MHPSGWSDCPAYQSGPRIEPRAMPRPPVPLEPVLDRPDLIRELLLANGPYWPVYRYFADTGELRASGAPVAAQGQMRVPPWFRADWAQRGPRVPGIEPILYNAACFRAARELYGLDERAVIRPQLVYVNVMLPMPAPDRGHVDVPAFRGIGRDRFPVWLLAAMGHSGLFDAWRIRIATAVSWWASATGGQLAYWPDGRASDPRVIPARRNSALVGENECMFHRVERVGVERDALALDALTTAAELVAEGADWSIREAGRELARVPFAAARVSVSWKAEVFEDAAAARVADGHLDDLDIERVWQTFGEDLRARGAAEEPGREPLANPHFIAALGAAYARTPTRLPA